MTAAKKTSTFDNHLGSLTQKHGQSTSSRESLDQSKERLTVEADQGLFVHSVSKVVVANSESQVFEMGLVRDGDRQVDLEERENDQTISRNRLEFEKSTKLDDDESGQKTGENISMEIPSHDAIKISLSISCRLSFRRSGNDSKIQ